MRMAKVLCSLVLAVSMMTFFACSDEYKFQNNNPDPEYRLFSILEDYPALEDAFSGIDQHEFNMKMADALNDKKQESVDILPLVGTIVTPLTGIIAAMRDILGRVVNQSNLDWPDDVYSYETDFYSFFDALSDSNPGLSEDLVTILNKSMGYINAVHREELDDIMADLITFLRDTDGTTVGSSVTLLQSVLGRLLLQCDQSMWLNDTDPYAGTLVEDRDDIAANGKYDTRLGNAVAGVDSLLSGLNQIATGDQAGRNQLYDIIREAGGLFTLDTNGDGSGVPFGTVLKQLIINIEKHATEGGSVYGTNTDYHRSTTTEYVNNELRNTVKEIWPAVQQLVIRSKKDDDNENPFAMFVDGGGKSPLEQLTRSLDKMGVAYDDAQDFEASLYRMVRYDTRQRDRLTDGSASNISYLEHLLFTLVVSGIYGYEDGGDTGEVWPEDGNSGHGHGAATRGMITLNDCLYNQGVPLAGIGGLGIVDAYDLVLNSPPGRYTYRSKDAFSIGDTLNGRDGDTPTGGNLYYFYLDSSYPANGLMPTQCIGDGGLPNGGHCIGEDGGYNSHITYWPYSPTGKGEMNTGRWTMGWIARACWEGEGPYYYAPENAEAVTLDGKSYHKYLRPNGSVYAYVYKPSDDPSTWEYFYPADNTSIDADDPAKGESDKIGGLQWRDNRYRETWYTEYHMIHTTYYDMSGWPWEWGTRYCYARPAGSAANSWIETTTISGSDYGNSWAAGRYQFSEKIAEHSASRECNSQEEAIYKNFQWVLGEKKFVYIIPMKVTLLTENAAVWVRIEGNGAAGLANAKKYISNNKRWLINGGTGDSFEPGDARIAVDFHKFSGILMSLGMVYDDSLGDGYVLPDAIGANMGALSVMGFFKDPVGATGYYQPIPSNDAGIGGSYWADRNKILLIGAAMLGDQHIRTRYVPASSGYDYNNSTQNRYPIKTVTDGLLGPMAKPFVYYQKNSGAYPRNCWKPRLTGDHTFTVPGNNRSTWYMPKENRTLISLLTESDYKKVDGLIPLLCQSRTATKLLALLQHMGDTSTAGGLYEAGGARKKVFYGLEQILTSIKSTKGEALSLGYSTMNYPSWMFADNALRPEEVLLDDLLDEFIGSNSLGKGLAVVPDTRPDPEDWENFDRMVAALGELMSVNGSTSGEYCITENVINLMDKLFTSFTATDDQLKGLRHTLGAVCTRYNEGTGTWEYPPELKNILTSYLPDILDAFGDKGSGSHYIQLLDMAAPLLADGGFVEYLLTSLNSSYSSEEVITQMYEFLTNNAYLTDPNSTFYDQLIALLESFVSLMDPNADGVAGRVMYDEATNPFYSYMGVTPPATRSLGGIDPYGALGELLAK